MRHLTLTFLTAFMMFSAPLAAQEHMGFFQTINDIPIMPGLYELHDDAVLFDKAQGRIAKSTAASNYIDPREIRSFYEQTLPQLGWQQTSPGIYSRAGEQLKMSLNQNQGYNLVHFTVEPH